MRFIETLKSAGSGLAQAETNARAGRKGVEFYTIALAGC
jgi:hypothetical protein